MFLRTMVAVRKKGDDATRWIKYMKKRHLEDNRHHSPALYVVGGTSHYLPDNSRNSKELSLAKFLGFWDANGIMRHTVIAPVKKPHSLNPMVLTASEAFREFHKMTGKENIITIYVYHTHTSYPHLHIFQVSPVPSRIYISPSQLEALKVILFNKFNEPIGKRAHVISIERKIRNISDATRIQELEAYKLSVINRYNRIEREIWAEISEMNGNGKKR